MTRLHIDWTRCDGHGLCTELLPELLDVDPWGHPLSRSEPDPEVPDALRADAAEAVRLCPRVALRQVAPRAAK